MSNQAFSMSVANQSHTYPLLPRFTLLPAGGLGNQVGRPLKVGSLSLKEKMLQSGGYCVVYLRQDAFRPWAGGD